MKASRHRKNRENTGLLDNILQRTTQLGGQCPAAAFRKFCEYMGLVKGKETQGTS
jgi:hypothetical protein